MDHAANLRAIFDGTAILTAQERIWLRKAADALQQMHSDLRRLAIKQHVRMREGGHYVPNGQSCAVCRGEWDDGAKEFHATTCPLAAGAVEQEAETK
jgi:hypothetical protein